MNVLLQLVVLALLSSWLLIPNEQQQTMAQIGGNGQATKSNTTSAGGLANQPLTLAEPTEHSSNFLANQSNTSSSGQSLFSYKK